MLSLKAIKNASDAAVYFTEKDNYYFSGEKDIIGAFEWHGKGADALGLHGAIDKNVFARILEGKLPNGEVVGLQKFQPNTTAKHRPGFDLTFSAPKSVSILALVYGDERLIKLHDKAVSQALNMVERVAQGRMSINGEIEFVDTNSLLVAKFRHDTSRALDPQLHTHSVVANVTQRPDGSWGALASDMSRKNGFFERVMDNQILFGVAYQSFLAKSVKDLGMNIRSVNRNGMFEIEGVPQELLDGASKRRQDILAELDKKGYFSLKAKDAATLANRPKKKAVDRDELREFWSEEFSQYDFDIKKFNENCNRTGSKGENKNSDKINPVALEAVRSGVASMSEMNMALSYHRITERALTNTLGDCVVEDILDAIDTLVVSKDLIKTPEGQFVSQQIIEREKRIIESINTGKKGDFSLPVNKTVIEKFSLPKEQCQAMADLLKSKDQLVLVDSKNQRAQKGFVEGLLNAGEHLGKNVRVITPTTTLAQDAGRDIARHPKTIWQWLKSFGREEVGVSMTRFLHQYKEELDQPLSRLRKGKDILLVDAAQRHGAKDIESLLSMAKESGAKVVFINDKSGQKSFLTGNIVDLFKKGEMKSVNIGGGTEEKVGASLLQIIDREERMKKVAQDYAMDIDKENTRVVSSSNADKDIQNSLIRHALKESGQLKDGVVINTFQQRYISDSEKHIAIKYKAGQVMRFYKRQKGNVDYKILDVSKHGNLIKTEDVKGNIAYTDARKVGKDAQILEHKALELSVGDRLLTTRSMREFNLKNNQALTVKVVGKKHVSFDVGGKTQRIKIRDLKDSFLDYDYATTLNKAGTRRYDKVMSSMTDRQLNKTVLTGLGRMTKGDLSVYTNNQVKAVEKMKQMPEKFSAISSLLDAKNQSVTHNTIGDLRVDIEKTIGALYEKAMIKENGISSDDQREKIAADALSFAANKMAERDAGFKHSELITTALMHALGDISNEDLKEPLKKAMESGDIKLGIGLHKNVWTTEEAISIEKEILSIIKEEKGNVEPLVQMNKVNELLATSNLNSGQKDACRLIATTKDRFVMVQGHAGTGKSTMLETVKSIIEHTAPLLSKDIQMKGLAPTHRAVEELSNKGIEAQTLQSFINHQKKYKEDLSNMVLVLDEFSMTNNRDFRDLTKIVQEGNGRLTYTGDMRQLLSPGSGKPGEVAAHKAGMAVAYMTDIMRQKTKSGQEAVQATLNRDYDKAFDKVQAVNPKDYIKRDDKAMASVSLETRIALREGEKSLIEIAEPKDDKPGIQEADNQDGNTKAGDLLDRIADDYCTREKSIRDETVVITQTRKSRKLLNERIRSGLKALGEVETKGVECTSLVQKDLTKIERNHLKYYKAGDTIKWGDAYYTVDKIDQKRGLLSLSGDSGTKILEPRYLTENTPLEVFEKQKTALAVGDKIRLTKSDPKRGLIANKQLVVNEIQNDKVQTSYLDDPEKSLELNLKDNKDRHWDYAYSSTTYGVQALTSKHVIAHLNHTLKHLTNQRDWLVALTRMSHHIMVYTSDKKTLLSKINDNPGDKYSALEVAGELDNKVVQRQPAKRENKESRLNAARNITAINNHSQSPRYNAKVINNALMDMGEEFYNLVLGTKGRHKGNEVKYGEGRAMYVQLSGEKRGVWYSWATNKGGSPLQLLQDKDLGLGLDFVSALKEGAKIAGLTESQATDLNLQQARKPVAQNNAQDKAHSEEKRQHAENILAKTKPIKDTIVEKYLLDKRGVMSLSAEAKKNLRFMPRTYVGKGNAGQSKYMPAMVAVARDAQGEFKCLQVTYLDDQTNNKADLGIKKRTHGPMDGGAVVLNDTKKNNQISFVAEGVETALSVSDACEYDKVLATLGKSNFKNIDVSLLTDKVVLCLDNDGTSTLNGKIIIEAAERLKELGKDVYIAMPERVGQDFNDIAKEGGIDAVKHQLEKSMSLEQFKEIGEKNREHELRLKANKSEIDISSLDFDKTKDKEAFEQENNIPKGIEKELVRLQEQI